MADSSWLIVDGCWLLEIRNPQSQIRNQKSPVTICHISFFRKKENYYQK